MIENRKNTKDLLLVILSSLFVSQIIPCGAFPSHSALAEKNPRKILLLDQNVGSPLYPGPKRNFRKDTFHLFSSSTDGAEELKTSGQQEPSEEWKRNEAYIYSLCQNLEAALDKWIITGSPASKAKAQNIIKQIEREAMTEDLAKRATRMASRAGFPLEQTSRTNNGRNTSYERNEDAQARKNWEKTFQQSTDDITKRIDESEQNYKRSALTSRLPSSSDSASEKAKAFTASIDANEVDAIFFANDKKALQDVLEGKEADKKMQKEEEEERAKQKEQELMDTVAAKTSELVARAGAGSAFTGDALGIGGLDDVLSQVKRRIWVPLAAPPSLLSELGINPVRGLLLYGRPGCGKTLLARTLGNILSPTRPITVVSGPEIMDKFVGSSEANLRAIFDNPPDLYPQFLAKDDGDSGKTEQINEIISKAALHVIVLDEFDAMARARGGGGGKEQGDAGVARDSVVNQLLAKMDGVDGLGVPTLVIGLTNKRTLIEPALLRPGRFEVQIEVPPPRTLAQRESIFKVHLKTMYEAGRLSVNDAPNEGSAAAKTFQAMDYSEQSTILSYDELVRHLSEKCDGMSGASIAGVCRAAASRALERAVCDFAGCEVDTVNGASNVNGSSIADCLVTKDDFELAIEDVFESSRGGDFSEDEETELDTDEDENTEEGPESEDIDDGLAKPNFGLDRM
eukprot:CAMPEP_0178960020 /NCGR_PEP_ID=MMETSP0789-20121207/12686_1 /TAXON_ID=3005 /ORGANISM="Rhizosolenia setigera, Strain CCMP 1694" /LENGTH=683 /DNA_ID=CAMNT_0020643231 /DNA_START=66 /DNA_END=2117 /DNA_ORIENTATION=+